MHKTNRQFCKRKNLNEIWATRKEGIYLEHSWESDAEKEELGPWVPRSFPAFTCHFLLLRVFDF